MEKEQLRRNLLKKRAAEADPQGKSAQIQSLISVLQSFKQARTLLFYSALPGEASLDRLLDSELLDGRRRVVLPYCSQGELGLSLLLSKGELTPGAFKVLELRPELRAEREMTPESVDLALIPGVGFDRFGNRLGYGKGYFDRLLEKSFLRSGSEDSPTSVRGSPCFFALGVCFHSQLVERLPIEKHDQRCDGIVTERGLLVCSERFRERFPEDYNVGNNHV